MRCWLSGCSVHINKIEYTKIIRVSKLFSRYKLIIIMTVCNDGVFTYEGDASALLVAIILGSLVSLYLLFRTCKLCNEAFSYSNFHIH